MTAMMRQIHKQTLTIAFLVQAILATGFFAPAAHASGLVSLFVTNPLTGVALDGMDPVSYFTETDPEAGRPDFEYDWSGVPWYFATAANRDVFMRSPEVYAPQFGGHGTMSLSRGYLSDGNPQIYLVIASRLYLFYSTANRDAFLLAPGPAIKGAETHWAELSKQLLARATPQ
jgi:YHS domain-containing protein